jgi:hypothetical protein
MWGKRAKPFRPLIILANTIQIARGPAAAKTRHNSKVFVAARSFKDTVLSNWLSNFRPPFKLVSQRGASGTQQNRGESGEKKSHACFAPVFL